MSSNIGIWNQYSKRFRNHNFWIFFGIDIPNSNLGNPVPQSKVLPKMVVSSAKVSLRDLCCANVIPVIFFVWLISIRRISTLIRMTSVEVNLQWKTTSSGRRPSLWAFFVTLTCLESFNQDYFRRDNINLAKVYQPADSPYAFPNTAIYYTILTAATGQNEDSSKNWGQALLQLWFSFSFGSGLTKLGDMH